MDTYFSGSCLIEDFLPLSVISLGQSPERDTILLITPDSKRNAKMKIKNYITMVANKCIYFTQAN